MGDFLNLLISGVFSGIIYSLIGFGFIVVYRSTQVFNFAQIGVILLGAFVGSQFMFLWGLQPWIGVPLLIIFGIVLGLLVERLVMHPLIGQPVMAIVIATLGLMVAFRGVITLFWGGLANQRLSLHPFIPEGTWQIGAVSISQNLFVSAVVCIGLIGLLFLFFNYTRMGLAMKVVHEDHMLAENLGIKVRRVFQYSWAIACVVGILAGMLIGGRYGIGTEVEAFGFVAIAAVIFGGLESFSGVLIAGIVIGIIQIFSLTYLTTFLHGDITYLVPFVFLLLIMIFKPYGLFGLREIERI